MKSWTILIFLISMTSTALAENNFEIIESKFNATTDVPDFSSNEMWSGYCSQVDTPERIDKGALGIAYKPGDDILKSRLNFEIFPGAVLNRNNYDDLYNLLVQYHPAYYFEPRHALIQSSTTKEDTRFRELRKLVINDKTYLLAKIECETACSFNDRYYMFGKTVAYCYFSNKVDPK